MWCFLFVLLLSAKYITSNRCPFETETPYCDCGSWYPRDVLNIKCVSPILPTNAINQYFEINLSINKISIDCFASPDWANFHYQFFSNAMESRSLIINDCIFKRDTNLSRIAELIRANNAKELHLTNIMQRDTTGFHHRLFQGFPRIEKLYITNNKNLIQINHDLLVYLPGLTQLHLVNNSLRTIPEDLLLFVPNIAIVKLSNNAIEHLPQNTFRNQHSLKQLDLSYNQLQNLEPTIFDSLINLETLFLDNNRFTWLPLYTFSAMQNLKYLDLQSNGIDSLLENLFQNNDNLLTLNLQNNQLKNLPNEIFKKLTNLNILNIDNNQLMSLSEDVFSTLKKLTRLGLSGNRLTSFLDLTFRYLPKLENLDLRHNKLDNLADSAFEKRQMDDFLETSPLFAGTLEKHNERGQKVENYPLVSIFFNCSSLVNLRLGNNSIHKIYDDWFLLSKMNLQSLDLSHNEISELHFNCPLRHINDFNIDLSHNKIASIVPNNFSNIKIYSLKEVTVDIRENPIKCDCNIVDLLRYVNFVKHGVIMNVLNIISDGLKCGQPEDHKGVLLTALKSDDLHCDLPSYQFHNIFCRMQCSVKHKFIDCNDPNTNAKNCDTNGRNIDKKETYQYNCTNKNVTIPSQQICILPETNVELDLTGNDLSNIPIFDSVEDYNAVTKLVLSENRITFLTGISSFKNLQSLVLEHNLKTILALTKDTLMELNSLKHLKHISFRRSMFFCNDDLMSLQDYGVSSSIVDIREIYCTTLDSMHMIYPFLKYHYFNPTL